MDLHDLEQFTRLSERLALHQNETTARPYWWLRIILGDASIEPRHRAVLLDVLAYLARAYEGRSRLTGAPAVVHPLRAAALLVRARGGTHLLDLLTVLLHDKREDLPNSGSLEAEFQALLKRIDPVDEWLLMERLQWLTRSPDQSYFEYIGLLLEHAQDTPELMRVKLGDRLDNLLDLRLDDFEQMPVNQFHEIVHRVLFDRSYEGFVPAVEHPLEPAPINGAGRLYQLFKSAAVLSLIREKGIRLDEPAARLFGAMCMAGMREGMRIVLHDFGYHWSGGVPQMRRVVLETMDYAQAGRLEQVTMPSDGNPLDGLFLRYFDGGDKVRRNAQLGLLYANKELMVRAGLAFILIFQRFLYHPSFHLGGLSTTGLKI